MENSARQDFASHQTKPEWLVGRVGHSIPGIVNDAWEVFTLHTRRDLRLIASPVGFIQAFSLKIYRLETDKGLLTRKREEDQVGGQIKGPNFVFIMREAAVTTYFSDFRSAGSYYIVSHNNVFAT